MVTPLEKSLTALVAERKFFRVDDAAELLDPPQAADNSVSHSVQPQYIEMENSRRVWCVESAYVDGAYD